MNTHHTTHQNTHTTMRGSYLHNRYRKPTGLPGELNHVLVEKHGGEVLLRSKATSKDHVLTGGSKDFYLGLNIGTHDDNHTANWMVDMLDAGVEFVDIETVIEEGPDGNPVTSKETPASAHPPAHSGYPYPDLN